MQNLQKFYISGHELVRQYCRLLATAPESAEHIGSTAGYCSPGFSENEIGTTDFISDTILTETTTDLRLCHVCYHLRVLEGSR